MAGELLLGCSGWNYADTADKGERRAWCTCPR
jgi:hypothetical protein